MELKDLRETLELMDKTGSRVARGRMDNLVVMDRMEKPLVLETMAIGGLGIKIQGNPLVELKGLRETLELMDKTGSLVATDRMDIPLVLVTMATGG